MLKDIFYPSIFFLFAYKKCLKQIIEIKLISSNKFERFFFLQKEFDVCLILLNFSMFLSKCNIKISFNIIYYFQSKTNYRIQFHLHLLLFFHLNNKDNVRGFFFIFDFFLYLIIL